MQSNQNKKTAIIIAGGKSSRMGTNKALLFFNGKRLIDNAIEIIKPICENILVSSNTEMPLVNYPIIKDEIKNLGPIGGLYTLLKKSPSELNLIIPCDVPNVTTELYNNMLELSTGHDVVVPKLKNGKLEPLVGIYKKHIVPIIEKQIEAKDYKLINLFEKLKVKYLQVEDESLFSNINYLSDLQLPKMPNLLLVAGTNRNVGKTTFVCKLIKQVATKQDVVAIKITPHFHELNPELPRIHESETIIIVQETNSDSKKDSSRMLHAGASKVYYVQTRDKDLSKALEILKPYLPIGSPVICESAALRYYIDPGCFVVMSSDKVPTKNENLIDLADKHIKNFEYNTSLFEYTIGSWQYLGD